MIFELFVVLRNSMFILLIVLAFILFYLFVLIKIVRKIFPFPVPAFLTGLIDNPIRRKFIQKPDRIADNMKLKPGMMVLEIGPGKGSYTKAVAKRILPEGMVFAIDIQKSVIKKLQDRLISEKVTNIAPKIGDAYNLSFGEGFFDRIFAVACLPEIPEPVRILEEFKRVLKKEGIISLCELFIDPDYPLRRTEKKWAKEAGLKFIEQYGNFFSYQLNFGREE